MWYSSGAPVYSWLASDEGGSGLEGYYFLLDNTAVHSLAELISTGTFTTATGYATPSALADAIWYFHLVALDRQKNYSDIRTYRINIDTAPAAPTNLTALVSNRAVTLSWTAPDPYPSDFAAYRLYIDSVAPYNFTDCFVVETASLTYTHWNLSESVTYYYIVRTLDAEPNQLESAWSNIVAIRPVEHDPPVILTSGSVTHPDGSVWYTTATPSFYWTAEDIGGSGVALYRYILSTTAAADSLVQASGLVTASTTFTAPAPLADGVWYFQFCAQDGSGNISTVSVLTARIDTQAPMASVALSSASPLMSGTYSATLVLLGDRSPLAGTPTLAYTPAGGTASTITLANVSGSTWTGSFSINSRTPNGTAVFSFSAVDAAGNTGTAITSGGTFVVDTSISSSTTGTVVAPDDTQVVIPPGASDVQINVTIDDTGTADAVIARANLLAVNYGNMELFTSAPYKVFAATEVLTGNEVTQFNVPATISITYADADADGRVDGDGIAAENLRLFRLNRDLAQWEPVAGQYLEKSLNRVSAQTSLLGTYALLASRTTASPAAGIVAYPNPAYLKYVPAINIGGIPLSAANVVVRIYDQNGVLVRTLSEASGEIAVGASAKQARWNGLNSSGERVATGVYIYLVKGDGVKTTGRIGILW